MQKTTENEIAKAIAALKRGGLVAIPTETVYGLAADATNAKAVANIFSAKGRPHFNPLISHCANLAMAEEHGLFNETARSLANTFWPGPLTLVVPRNKNSTVCDLTCAGLDTIALRVPQGLAGQLIEQAGIPLAAPSANPSGKISPTMADHVRDGLGDKVDMILDEGACAVGVESTILAVTDNAVTLLRAGGLAAETIEEALGAPIERATNQSKITAPGMLSSHYAPNAPMRLNADHAKMGEASLTFGEAEMGGSLSLNLSPKGNLTEAAANLYAYMRILDQSGIAAIAVAPIPMEGLGEAINDRLMRAAAPR